MIAAASEAAMLLQIIPLTGILLDLKSSDLSWLNYKIFSTEITFKHSADLIYF